MTPPPAARHRTLRFEGGVSRTTILDATDGDPRIRTDFGVETSPTATGDVVVPRPGLADRMLRRPSPRCIWLPAGDFWSIEVDGPASQLEIHLDAALWGVDIKGSVSQAFLRLPGPGERVPIDISGSVSALTVDVPAATAVTVEVRGNVRDLQVGQRSIRATTGPVAFGDALDRSTPGYHLRIAGSAADVRISDLQHGR